MNHRETIRRREPRVTQRGRGVLASIRPRIADVPHGTRVHGRGDRVTLRVEDCSPAGLKMFMNREQVTPVTPLIGDYVLLSNGYLFEKRDIDRLFTKAGVTPVQLERVVSLRRGDPDF